MSWARLDDRYDDNRKIKRAWRAHPRAVGLHAMAITYSARHETDGVVDTEWFVATVPHAAERKRVLATLVDCGLFEPLAGGAYRVHDFLDYNASKRARRDASDAGRKAARIRWAQREPPGEPCDSHAERMPNPMPPPTHPHPTHIARDSPDVCGRATATARAASLSPPGNGKASIAAHVSSVLEGGVDGLTTDEGCRRPTPGRVLAVLGEASEAAVVTAAWEARSIAQSQNRAPDIVALFAQRLGAAL